MIEEYEMVSQDAVSARTSNSSHSSIRSQIFEEIDEYAKDDENFHNSPLFQRALQNYTNSGAVSKRLCYVLGSFFLISWLIGLLIYSRGSALDIVSKLTHQTSVEMSGRNITLNEYLPSFKNITMQNQRKGLYTSFKEQVGWLNKKQYPIGGTSGGYFLARTSKGGYQISQLNTEYSNVLFETTQFPYKNNFFYMKEVILNPAHPVDDLSIYHIIVSDKIVQFRQLSFAIYWLYNKNTNTYTPIQPPMKTDKNPLHAEYIDKLHFAEFSPKGDHVVFGFNHDLYIQNLATLEVRQITDTGSLDIFNGKSDWVYEEEIAPSDKLFWWSQDQKNLVFATLNDTKVQDYELDFYIKDRTEIGTQYSESDQEKVDEVNQYPIKTSIKYPKPGTPNPVVTLFNYRFEDESILEIKVDKSFGEDFLLYSCSWVDNSSFLMKQTDRYSRTLLKTVYLPGTDEVVKISVLNSFDEYGGWIDKMPCVTVLPNGQYVDRLVVHNRTHLALFENVLSNEFRFLTKASDWGIITDSPVVYDALENSIYTLTSMRSSMDAHLVAIDLKKSIPQVITGTDRDGLYDINFSPDGQYLNLFYRGPEQPWQRLINMGEVHDELKGTGDFLASVITGVDEYILRNKIMNHYEVTKLNLKSVNLPTKLYKQIAIGKFPDGKLIMVNMIEILPPNFDPLSGKKYPILVHAYGGPGSQTVDKSHSIDFQVVSSAALDAIVLIIDPRGTGGQSWNFEAFAQGKLGYWEPRDLSTIVSEYISVNSKFINKDKTALWGWSYGGFTTLKTLEFDEGKTFKFGAAVAPVTNWLFYDSVYTERFMGAVNKNYEKYSKIKIYKSFTHVKRFLIMHGTSDDNVHLQNLLWLLDKLNLNSVENYDVHFFPDSDHSIYYHNANSIVYDKLLNWVGDAFRGKFDADRYDT